MSSEDLKKLEEIAKVGVVLNDKTLKIQKNIDEVNYNNNQIANFLEGERSSKERLLELIKNKATKEEIDLEINRLETINKDNINLIELKDIETNIDNLDWEDFVNYSNYYAEKYELDLENPYLEMSSNVEMSILAKELHTKFEIKKLDKDDIIVATVAGVLAGLVDAFLIGTITNCSNGKKNEKLVNITDKAFEKMVEKYAKHQKINEYRENIKKATTEESKEKLRNKMEKLKKDGFKDSKKAITFLENKFKVNYDHSTKNTIFPNHNVSKLSPDNHHFRSLAHDPSPLGLFFGILDQLDNKTTLINDLGKWERVTKNKTGLPNFSDSEKKKRIVQVITTWFGHIMSDIAGSKSSKGRGRGLPVPFMTALGFINVGEVKVKESGKIVEKTIGQLVEKMFVEGYDIRAFTAQLIPVLVYETIIRAYWFYKEYFFHKKEFSKSIPLATKENYTLSRMLLIGASSFSLVDVGHATIKTGIPPVPENIMTFLLTINYPGLLNLGYSSYQNIRNSLLKESRINNELKRQLKEDIENLF